MVEWGKDAIHSCRALDSTVRQEACVYGVTSTIAGDFARAKQRFIEYGARDIQGYVGYTMRFGLKSLCPGLKQVSAEARQAIYFEMAAQPFDHTSLGLSRVNDDCMLRCRQYKRHVSWDGCATHCPLLITRRNYCAAIQKQRNTLCLGRHACSSRHGT